MHTIPLRTVGIGPVVTDPHEITEDTPDSTVVSINAAAYLTGHSVQSLRKFRETRRGPTSFVFGHAIRYRLGDIRDFVQKAYDTTSVSA